MYSAILDEADELSTRTRAPSRFMLEELRLREQLPKLLAQSSPMQRAIMRDHLHDFQEVVAFIHQTRAVMADVPKRGA